MRSKLIKLITLLIAGSAIAYVSRANLMPVSVTLGQYVIEDIPLFYVMVGSLLVGLVFSYLLQILRNISYSFVLRGKKREINTGKGEVAMLTKRVHQLEIENEKLKRKYSVPTDTNAL